MLLHGTGAIKEKTIKTTKNVKSSGIFKWLGCRDFQQYISYIVAVSFIGTGNGRKPPFGSEMMYWIGSEQFVLAMNRVGAICSCNEPSTTTHNKELFINY